MVKGVVAISDDKKYKTPNPWTTTFKGRKILSSIKFDFIFKGVVAISDDKKYEQLSGFRGLEHFTEGRTLEWHCISKQHHLTSSLWPPGTIGKHYTTVDYGVY